VANEELNDVFDLTDVQLDTSAPEVSRRISAEKTMPTALRKISEEIEQAKSSLGKIELNTEYTIAEKLLFCKEDPQTYGTTGLQQLASRHNFSSSQVSNYVRVAEVFTEEDLVQFVEYNKKQTSRYNRITFSHLCQFSRVSDDDTRQAIIMRTCKEGLPIAEVAKLVDDNKVVANLMGGSEKSLIVKPVPTLNAGLKLCDKFNEVTARVMSAEFNARVMELAQGKSSKKLFSLLDDYSSCLSDLAEIVKQQEKTLSDIIEKAAAVKAGEAIEGDEELIESELEDATFEDDSDDVDDDAEVKVEDIVKKTELLADDEDEDEEEYEEVDDEDEEEEVDEDEEYEDDDEEYEEVDEEYEEEECEEEAKK